MPKTADSTLLERRCIRKYAAQSVSAEDLVFRNTSTSSNARQFSVIEVTQRGLEGELAALLGQK